MDLDHHGLAVLGEHLLRRYLRHGEVPDDVRPLPLFLSLRAATRSFTQACSAGRQPNAQLAADKARRAQALLRQAEHYLERLGAPTDQAIAQTTVDHRSRP